MIGTKRLRMQGARKAGFGLVGLLATGLALASGTAFASAGSPSAGMAGMSSPGSPNHVGNTKGWFDGRTVTFHYTRNFFCQNPPSSGAATHCEAGNDYIRTPSGTFDPLYVVVPLASPRRSPPCSARPRAAASTIRTPSTCPPCSAAAPPMPCCPRTATSSPRPTVASPSGGTSTWSASRASRRGTRSWPRRKRRTADVAAEARPQRGHGEHPDEPVPVLRRQGLRRLVTNCSHPTAVAI